jgi:hypothetical protein
MKTKMPVWILRPYKLQEDGSMKLDYEKEKLYFSYEALHAYVLQVAFDLECEGKSAQWCEVTEYENESDGTMEANWIYKPVNGTAMNRWPVIFQG